MEYILTSELTIDFLLIELSLYNERKIHDPEPIVSFISEYRPQQLDIHCISCQKNSTFKKITKHKAPMVGVTNSVSYKKSIDTDSLTERAFKNIQGTHTLKFECQRDDKHVYYFYFKVDDDNIIKIGQYPSIADIELHKINKYRSLLRDDYREFSKAIGLYSHGIGAGSYVYLRRIFENLINEQKDAAIESDSSLSEEVYNKKRMEEKILYIKDFLPDLLVQNRSIYGILSKGIHELSEDECLDMFPKLELGIEIILDWKLAEKEKQEKENRFSRFISDTVGKLKS